MRNENVNLKHLGLMGHIFLPVILIIASVKLIFSMTYEYVFIVRVLCLCISVLIFIVSRVKIKNRDLGILKYLGGGYFFITIIIFWGIENWNISTNIKVSLIFTQAIIYFEMLNILFSIIVYYKNYKGKLHWIILSISTIIVILVLIEGNKSFTIVYNMFTSTAGAVINQIIMCILFVLSIILYSKLRFPKKEAWIIKMGFLLLLSNTFLFLELLTNMDLIFFIYISKLMSYFLLYNKFEGALLVNAYSSAYEILNNVKEIKKKLNRSLIRREKELKELNLLLEKSEKKYLEVVQAFSNGILIFENDILTYSNYSNEKYYNIKNEEYKNSKILSINEILKIITGKEYPKDKEIDEFSTEVKVLNDNGKESYLEVSLIKIYDNRKILIFNNIDKIVSQREEIVKIEKKIAEENIKDEFYSNISHELRTPINVIYSALQLNDIYLENKEIIKINKNNNVIRQNCLRLIRTINNFIDSNKLSEGFLERNIKVYNIVEIIENIILSCDFYMKLKNVKLIYDPKYEEVYLFCDKNHIERIMLNILSNSLKYGRDNGNIYVTIKVNNNEKIVIEVTNDAEVIPEDKRREIFDKFTKVDTSLNRPSEGSGLGLYLTKGLVELNGGEISINSGEKFGNTFKMVLPYDREFSSKEVPKKNNEEINNLKQKIDIEFSDIYF